MRKITTSLFLTALFLLSALSQSASAQVFVDGGELDLEGVFGDGELTSYFVIDFGGSPESATGPRDSYAFGYRFDDPNTTAADGLLGIEDASDLVVEISEFSFGLFADGFAFGADSDSPGFGDTRGQSFAFFASNLDDGTQGFALADSGISDILLEDDALFGFRSVDFSAPINPSIPLVAVPEPSAVLLLGIASMVGCVRRRRA